MIVNIFKILGLATDGDHILYFGISLVYTRQIICKLCFFLILRKS